MKRTLVAIKALPEDINKWNYKPDPKTRSALQIICHILPHAESLSKAIDSRVIAEGDKPFNSVKEAYDYYEKHSNELSGQELEKLPDTAWENELVSLEVRGFKLSNQG